MSSVDREECYKKFLDKNGLLFEMQIAIEEMSELTKELCKYTRKKGKTSREDMMSEIADVMNTTEQLANYFGREEIEKIRDEKFRRAMKKME